MRGFIARRIKFKRKNQYNIAYKMIVEQMINNYMEDKFIPDLLISILRKN
jgi:hypothetical protein